jgi:S-layer homology domain.
MLISFFGNTKKWTSMLLVVLLSAGLLSGAGIPKVHAAGGDELSNNFLPIVYVRNFPVGEEVVVEGIVSTGAGVFDNAFYIQDGSSGIMAVHDVPEGSLQAGDIVQVHGKLQRGDYDLQITFDSFADDVVVTGHTTPPEPIKVSGDAARYLQYQGTVVKVKGIVTGKFDENSYIINDRYGEVLVLTDGDIVNQTGPVPEAEIGDTLEATGLSSGYFDGARARIRVRDTKELTVIKSPGDILLGLTVYDKTNRYDRSPDFNLYEREYSVDVDSNTTQLLINAVTANPHAAVKINGELLSEAEQEGKIVNLTNQVTIFSIVVSSPDQQATETYTLTVTKKNLPHFALDNIIVKDQSGRELAFTESFYWNDLAYEMNLDDSVTSLSIESTPVTPEGYVVTYSGVAEQEGNKATLLTPDNKTYTVFINVRLNNIAFVYQLDFKRGNPKDTSMKELSVFDNTNEVYKSPVVTPDVKNYSVEVESNTKQLLMFVVPTGADADVSITGGVQDPDEPIKAMFDIPDKTTVFTIKVTSPDGTMTETYTLTVTKKDAPVVTPPVSGGGGGGDVAVPSSPLEEALNNATSSTITVKVSGTSFSISAAELAKFLAQNKVETIVFDSQAGSYVFNPGQYDWNQLTSLLGLTLTDLQLKLEITNDHMTADSADKAGLDVLGSVNFKLKAVKKDGQEIVLNDLGHYIKHAVKLDSQPASGHVAAVRADTDANGKTIYTPVPFTMSGSDISIMSRTDGTFLIVQTDKTFDDTASHWAKDEIDALGNLLIVDGVGEGVFDPNRSITRAEFTALVVRLFGLTPPAAAGNSRFEDVQANDWFTSVVAAATGAGLINGYENGEFRPDQTITREEMAVILSRGLAFAGSKGDAAGTGAFADQSDIPAWAAEAVSQLAGFGIVNGKPGNEFDPAGEATRAESVVMLYRLLSILTFTK